MNWNFTVAKQWIAKVVQILTTAITTTGAITGASLTTTSNGAITAHGSGAISSTTGAISTGGAVTGATLATTANGTITAHGSGNISTTTGAISTGGAISGATLASSAGTTVGTTLGVSGASTLTGGVVATSQVRSSTIPIGSVALGSLGTSAVHSAGAIYFTEIEVLVNRTVTGIAILNGATAAATDKGIVGLYDSAGANLLGNSALAGAGITGANAWQEYALTAPLEVVGPARYWVAFQCEGTTDTTRRIAASTFLNMADVVAGSWGTLPATITPATSTAADEGPIAYLY